MFLFHMFFRFSHQSGPANIVRSRLFEAHYPLLLDPDRWRCHRPAHPAVVRAVTALRTRLSTEDPCRLFCGSLSELYRQGHHRELRHVRPRGRLLEIRRVPVHHANVITRPVNRPASTHRAILLLVNLDLASLHAPLSPARQQDSLLRSIRRWEASVVVAWAPATALPTRSCSSTMPRRRQRRGVPPTYFPRPPRTHSARSELRFSSQFF